MKKVLLIEDDTDLAFMIKDGLESEGFDVFHITNGEEMMEVINELSSRPPDIILLDVNLKGAMNGFELSNKIRLRSQVPIIFTTARTQIEDIQEGFKIGNVDYLKKPFGTRELILRINELLSRNQAAPTWQENTKSKREKPIQLGNYLFYPIENSLHLGDKKIHLQKNECTVLKLLCKNKDKMLNKTEILEIVWSNEDLKQKEASLNNILSTLRFKLNKDKRVEIQTIPKTGYRLIVK